MKKLLVASNNAHKIDEIKKILSDIKDLQVVSLKDENIFIDVEETADTLEGNALLKAKVIHSVSGLPVISDDTGLFVEELNNEPGVYSARYAGENSTYLDNCKKLISKLKEKNLSESPAHFKAVICYIDNSGKEKFFEGVINGKVSTEMRGKNGFGYDPLFVADGMNKTFAELTDEEKNTISHRGVAIKKFAEFYKKNC
ncbi:MAG TPA: RdgB/HAM1 family non-canonical purine NTP pyrophosphatase [Ignavibacteria bacterium]|nr:RdgB/HAM1 family non-canonical purine NTP pyrophosphatase [Ignavibacteria bacterium]